MSWSRSRATGGADGSRGTPILTHVERCPFSPGQEFDRR